MRIFLNLHIAFQNWSRSLGGVLTRAEFLAWRNIAVKIGRDVRFLLSVLIIVLTAAASIYSLAAQVPTLHWGAATLSCLAGFSLYKGLYFAPGSARRLVVQSGPFHPWTAFAPQLERWCRLRAIILTGLCLCLLSLPIVMARPDAALLFLGLGCLGAAASVATSAIFKGRRRKAWRLPRFKMIWAIRKRLPPLLWVDMAAAVRRKVGPFPILWLVMSVWGLAGAAAGLAARNNEDNHLGVCVLTIAGLICGGILTWPDLSLVRFLAYSAAKTRRVIVAASAPRLVLSGLMALVAGGLAGLPIVLTLMSFGFVMACLSVWLLLLITFGMTKTETGAIGFALTEVFLAIVLDSFFQTAIVAAPWLVGRAAFNYQRANRRRWREPK